MIHFNLYLWLHVIEQRQKLLIRDLILASITCKICRCHCINTRLEFGDIEQMESNNDGTRPLYSAPFLIAYVNRGRTGGLCSRLTDVDRTAPCSHVDL